MSVAVFCVVCLSPPYKLLNEEGWRLLVEAVLPKIPKFRAENFSFFLLAKTTYFFTLSITKPLAAASPPGTFIAPEAP